MRRIAYAKSPANDPSGSPCGGGRLGDGEPFRIVPLAHTLHAVNKLQNLPAGLMADCSIKSGLHPGQREVSAW